MIDCQAQADKQSEGDTDREIERECSMIECAEADESIDLCVWQKNFECVPAKRSHVPQHCACCHAPCRLWLIRRGQKHKPNYDVLGGTIKSSASCGSS